MKVKRKEIGYDGFKWTGGDYETDPQWFKDALTKGNVAYKNAGTPEVSMVVYNEKAVPVDVERGSWVIRRDDGVIFALPDHMFRNGWEVIHD